jgi:hypothetical protein
MLSPLVVPEEAACRAIGMAQRRTAVPLAITVDNQEGLGELAAISSVA